MLGGSVFDMPSTGSMTDWAARIGQANSPWAGLNSFLGATLNRLDQNQQLQNQLTLKGAETQMDWNLMKQKIPVIQQMMGGPGGNNLPATVIDPVTGQPLLGNTEYRDVMGVPMPHTQWSFQQFPPVQTAATTGVAQGMIANRTGFTPQPGVIYRGTTPVGGGPVMGAAWNPNGGASAAGAGQSSGLPVTGAQAAAQAALRQRGLIQ